MEEFQIRRANKRELPFLKEMLYLAMFVFPGEKPFPREILEQPPLSKTFEDWGGEGNMALIAFKQPSQEPVGAVWARVFKSDQDCYGFVDDHTPVLGIALLPDYRGKGLGTQLMKKVIEQARMAGFTGISLSVDKRNSVFSLYQKLGFEIVSYQGNPTMLLKL